MSFIQVTDAQGRRRFHGAFTGGFSAGYYNSVGSEKGWAPQTFSSSRGNRSSRVEQRPEDFMDEEDDPLLGKRLETSEHYDTLQTGAKRRLQQQQQQVDRFGSGAIPGLALPDDWVLPVNESIGAKLLKQMGWKEGHGIGQRLRRRKFQDEAKRRQFLLHATNDEKGKEESQDEAEEEVYVPPRKVFDVQKVFPKPKVDRYGAGFDPYVNAPEFLRFKQQQQKAKEGLRRQEVSFLDALSSTNGSNRETNGYGLSALEENDDVDVYGTVPMTEFDRMIAPLGSENSIKRIDSSAQESRRHEKTRRSRALCSDGRSVLPGFKLAVSKEKPPKAVNMSLAVPAGFTAYHRFDEDEDQDDAVTALYRKFNFSTDTTNNRMIVTAKQRSAILEDSTKHTQGVTDGVEPDAGEATKPVTSVFDLLGEDQKAKLFDAAKQAKQGLPPPAVVEQPAALKDRQPLIRGDNGDQFRATISASIAKRFLSSKSMMSDDMNDSTPRVSQAKVSHRSQDLWIPNSLLCKRFHVKCMGPTGSIGKDDKSDKKRDLFNEELVPHLMEFAADRAAHRQPEVNVKEANKSSKDVKVEEVEMKDLPPLPAVEESSARLLQSIFQPSDESELSESSSEDESNDGDSDEEQKSVSKQELLSSSALVASGSGVDARGPQLNGAEDIREVSSCTDDETSIRTVSAAPERVNVQVKYHRKRSHSIDSVDGRDVNKQAKEERRKHKKHKKQHKHRTSRDSKDKKKDKKERKSHKRRSSRHSRRSRSAERSPSRRRSSSRRG